MRQDYTELDTCLCCENPNLRTVLDLGFQPLANNSIKSAREFEKFYPLMLNFCNECTHLQLKYAVDPDLMFRNYLYETGSGTTISNYLHWFVGFTTGIIGEEDNKKVLDIACNDGTLLDIYKEYGYQTYGVDPSLNLYKETSKRHNVECDYLNWDYANAHEDMFDFVVAQNVMAHNSYPLEFLQMCHRMVTKRGIVLIQNSQANMIEHGEFDTIYHEHVSYYSIKSFRALADLANLTAFHIQRVPIHGGSNLYVLSKSAWINDTFHRDEYRIDDESVDEFADKARNTITWFRQEVIKLREEGFKVIGYGAAAKGNTVLNTSNIALDYIVDDTPAKQGLFTPGQHIPIVSSSFLTHESGQLAVVILPWNFYDEIVDKVYDQTLNVKELMFIRLFPEIEVRYAR